MTLEINIGNFNTTTIVTFISIIYSYLKLSDNLGYLGKFGKYLKNISYFRTKVK